MRKLLFICVAISTVQFAFAQKENSITNGDALKKETDVLINTLSKKMLFEIKESTVTASKVAYYNKDSQVVLITLDNKDSEGYEHVTYYYKNDELIYCEQARSSDGLKWLVDKLYLENEVLAHWLDSNNKPVDTNSKSFETVNRRLSVYAQTLLDSAR